MKHNNINNENIINRTMSSINYIGENVLRVPCQVKRYSKYIDKFIDFDFKKLNIKRDGLFEEALESLEKPCHFKRTVKFLKDVQFLLEDERIVKILSNKTSEISVNEISYLFTEHDKYLSSLDMDYKEIRSSHFRSYFKVSTSLKNGNRISDLKLQSIHKKKYRDVKKTLISESEDPGEENKDYAIPISNIQFSSLEELEDKAEIHLRNRVKRIEDSCWDIVEKHMQVVKRHEELKLKPLPDQIVYLLEHNNSIFHLKKYYNQNNDGLTVLQFLLHYIELNKLYITRAETFGMGKIIPDVSLYEVGSNCNPNTLATLLASYFLPKIVLVACQYLLQIYTKGWNPDVIRSLSTTDLEYLSDIKSFRLKGYKSKTGQNLAPIVFDDANSRPFQLLQLLEINVRNINKYGLRQGDFLLAGYCRISRDYGLFNPKSEHQEIISRYKLPFFSAGEIRDQVINFEYLKSGKDILYTKELLGHADFKTIDNYLNQHIQKVLNDANINKFMSQLALSIVWSVDPDLFNNMGFQLDKLNKNLLFPVGLDHVESSYICDQSDFSHLKIELGLDEIKHCIFQKHYYKNNFQFLKTSNPARFSKVHLPRIVFAIALYQIISESKFGYLLRKLDSELLCRT
jgi:hypothetical protein